MPVYGTRIRFLEAFFIGIAILLIIIRVIKLVMHELGKDTQLEKEILEFCE